MLSLAVTVPLKRRTLRERLHLCRNERIIKETFSHSSGEINIYRIYHYCATPFFTPERLQRALKENLYTSDTPPPYEYIKRAVILRLIEKLRQESGKTVFLKKELADTPFLNLLCRYAAKVYIMSGSLPESAEEIYKNYGTLPICLKIPIAADFCPDEKEPFTVSLPKELESICPEEFSPLLFAALLYKENGIMIY